MITIDFETRSKINLKKVGAWKYAEHPSTSILCLAYNMTGDPFDTMLWTPGKRFPDELMHAIVIDRRTIEAHNSFFEFCIWNFVGRKKYGFPRLNLSQLNCSMAKARAHSLPGSLAAAGDALDLKIKKDKRGNDLINLLCVPQKPSKDKPSIWIDDPDLMQELYQYCMRDVNTEITLSDTLPALSDREKQIWLLDQKINARGIKIDVEAVEGALKILADTVKHYGSKIAALAKGAFVTLGQRDKILKWCAARGMVLDGWTKNDVSNALKNAKDLPEDVRQILELRQILGRTSTKKYVAMLDRLANDGRVHGDTLVYHKAHTGRWAGVGIQIQNLPRPTIYDDPEKLIGILKTEDFQEAEFWYDDTFDLAASAIRSCIVPAEGKKFISADYSSIEPRVLFWISEDAKSLKIFEQGRDIYIELAASIYKTTYKDIVTRRADGDSKAAEQRAVGKAAALGLGYQMGADRFCGTCEGFDIPISIDFAKRAVRNFRDEFKKVVSFWYGVEKAAREAIETPGLITTFGKIQFRQGKTFLKCKLPSGRFLHYPFARLKMQMTSWGEPKLCITYKGYKDEKWIDKTTYGGKLTENIVQAIARDIMCDAMLRLEDNNYTLVMSVHDELVAEVPENFGSVDEFCGLMNVVPTWAQGLPIATEGWEGYRYRK